MESNVSGSKSPIVSPRVSVNRFGAVRSNGVSSRACSQSRGNSIRIVGKMSQREQEPKRITSIGKISKPQPAYKKFKNLTKKAKFNGIKNSPINLVRPTYSRDTSQARINQSKRVTIHATSRSPYRPQSKSPEIVKKFNFSKSPNSKNQGITEQQLIRSSPNYYRRSGRDTNIQGPLAKKFSRVHSQSRKNRKNEKNSIRPVMRLNRLRYTPDSEDKSNEPSRRKPQFKRIRLKEKTEIPLGISKKSEIPLRISKKKEIERFNFSSMGKGSRNVLMSRISPGGAHRKQGQTSSSPPLYLHQGYRERKVEEIKQISTSRSREFVRKNRR
jgi:hypothetical protein